MRIDLLGASVGEEALRQHQETINMSAEVRSLIGALRRSCGHFQGDDADDVADIVSDAGCKRPDYCQFLALDELRVDLGQILFQSAQLPLPLNLTADAHCHKAQYSQILGGVLFIRSVIQDAESAELLALRTEDRRPRIPG